MDVPGTSARAAPFVLVLVGAVLAAGGCVERKLVLVSDPPGASVWLEDEPVPGRTPVEVPFEWGGLRRVTLVAPGHRILETTAEVEDPWYTYFPVDVFAEFLWPATIEDRQTFRYRLDAFHPADRPFTDQQREEIRDRMDALKLRAEEYRAGGSEGPGGSVGSQPAPLPKPTAPAAPPPPPPPPPMRPGSDRESR